jgi:hypothetical protein
MPGSTPDDHDTPNSQARSYAAENNEKLLQEHRFSSIRSQFLEEWATTPHALARVVSKLSAIIQSSHLPHGPKHPNNPQDLRGTGHTGYESQGRIKPNCFI